MLKEPVMQMNDNHWESEYIQNNREKEKKRKQILALNK